MIIIEGTDLVGKTVLCHHLVRMLDKLGAPHIYAHISKLPDAFHPYSDYIPLINPNVVQDRFHLSRQTYGAVFKNQHVNTRDVHRLLDAHVRLAHGFIVVITMPPDRLRLLMRDDEMYDIDGIIAVNEEFCKLVKSGEVDVDMHIALQQHDWAVDYREDIINAYLARRNTQLDALCPKVDVYGSFRR